MMAFLKKPDPTEPNHLEWKQKKRERLLPLVVVALLAILALSGTLIFYRYLDNTLFQERNSHFIEISDKVTQVVESVVQHYRTTTRSAETLLLRTDPQDLNSIPNYLEEIQNYLTLEHGTVLVFDDKAQFYASDGITSNWRQLEILSNDKEEQELVTTLDYRADDTTYILFIRKLKNSITVEERQITHICVAVNISIFQRTFNTDIFQNQSHIYIVNPNGRRLYRHEYSGDFIDSYNLLTTLEDCRFVHGGTLDDLRKTLLERTSAGYEFYYEKERYFVAASPVPQTNWAILTFIPTEILGSKTTVFLNTAITFFSIIAALVVLMMGLIMSFFIAKQGDQRLIAHQKQVNVLLQDAADAAHAASIAKSDFLSHMSHDIRTPINGIMGMTDIALKNLNNTDKVLDCLKKIESSSGHLLSLVNDVLDMSRIESGKTKIACEPIDIRQIIEHCSSIIGGQLQGRDIELVEEFAQLSYPYVLGDELHLRQILINILGNAVKFTPDGGKIYFRIQEISVKDDVVLFRIEIEDTGIGMKPEFLPKIFDAFVQEDDGMRSSYKGTGLGMTITKQFIDLMGGKIQVESQLNVGSCFTVDLPAKIDRKARNSSLKEPQRIDFTGIHLLLVEDNELNMEIAQYLLEYEGAIVTPASDGQTALQIFSSNPPGTFDGILMDIMMPVMDGLSAAKAIRALKQSDAKTIPIIAMTANAYDEDKRRCLEAGMNDHVSKPIDGPVLFQVLARYIKMS